MKPYPLRAIAVCLMISAATARADETAELLERLISSNEANLAKIRDSVSFRLTISREQPDGSLVEKRSAQLRFRGSNSWCECILKQPQEMCFRTLVRESIAVWWVVGTSNPQYWELGGRCDEDARRSIASSRGADPFLYAGGTGKQSLRQFVYELKSRPDHDVTVEETAAEQFAIRIKPVGFVMPRFEFLLNAKRGYLIEEAIARDAQGVVLEHIEISGKQPTNSENWIPESIHLWRYSAIAAQTVVGHDVFQLSEISAAPVPDEMFQLQQLGIPDGTYLCTHRNNGNREPRVMRAGKLIPTSAEMALHAATRPVYPLPGSIAPPPAQKNLPDNSDLTLERRR